MKQKIEVFICTHKNYKFYSTEMFRPLLCGAFKNEDIGIEKDSTGDNISERNDNYSELTGLYWIWKNSDADIKGLFHYRRYLKLNRKKINKILDINYNENDIYKILEKVDIILPRRIGSSKKTLKEVYKSDHIEEDWNEMVKVINELYPDDSDIIEAEFSQRKFYPLNMLIARRELFDEYCEWLFSILFELEKRITISENPYQARVFGFLSERLMGVFIKKKNLKVKELKVIEIREDGTIYVEPPKFIRSILKRWKKLKGEN